MTPATHATKSSETATMEPAPRFEAVAIGFVKILETMMFSPPPVAPVKEGRVINHNR